MDVPGRPDDSGPWATRAEPGRAPEADFEGRLEVLEARLEGRLEVLEARLDALEAYLSETVEAACRAAVASELQGLSEDMRRAISELGRLLLRDLDRLTKVLAEHRDAIVERLLDEVAPPAAEPAEEAEELGAEPAAEPTGERPEIPEATRLTGEEGRWRVLPGRRGRPAWPERRAGPAWPERRAGPAWPERRGRRRRGGTR